MNQILFVCARFYPYTGGVEKHVYKLSKELISFGYDVSIVTVSKNDLIEYENYEGINIYRINAGKDGFMNRLIVNFKFAKKIKLFINSDIVHFHDYFPLWGWNLFNVFYLKLIKKKKIYLTFHGWEGIFPPSNSVIIKRRIVEKICNGTISIGHYISKWYKTDSGIISYGATDTSECFTTKNKTKKIEKFLFIGRLEKDTGILDYLESISKVENKTLQIDICGDGYLKNVIEEKIKNIPHRITLHGFVDNINEMIERCDVVLTSGYLGMLESFSHKKPVISIYDNDIKRDYLKLIPNYKKLFLICDDDNNLSSLISKLEDIDYRDKMTGAAFDFSVQHDWIKMKNNYLKLWGAL